VSKSGCGFTEGSSVSFSSCIAAMLVASDEREFSCSSDSLLSDSRDPKSPSPSKIGSKAALARSIAPLRGGSLEALVGPKGKGNICCCPNDVDCGRGIPADGAEK